MPEPVLAELERSFELDAHDSDEPCDRTELIRRVAGQEGLFVTPADRVDDDLLDAAGTGLRVVATFAVGYDNIDLAACSRRGILVANTPDVLSEATAELTIALVLALLRRVVEGDRLLRRREPWVLAPTWMIGRALGGLTLGIVGYGRIGQAVGRLAAAHGMRVVHSSRSGGLGLPELLAGADVVSLHVPLTPETRHLIDAEALALMKPDAVLVNVSRGPMVDENALVEALRGGRIGGAGLDVFEREPEVHPGLLELENVVLVPHIGSATHGARTAMGMLCVQGLRAVLLDARAPENSLNPEVLRR